MPLILDNRETKFSIEDLDRVLSDDNLVIIHLWIKALMNSLHLSEKQLKLLLVEYVNRMLEKRPFLSGSAYHALFFTLYDWCFKDWKEIIEIEEQKRGFVSDEDKVALDKSMMHFFHDFVIARDKYQCQMCGKSVTINTAHVHHIWQRYNTKGQVIGPSTLFNLITLCQKCHEKLHPWMSNSAYNTPES